MRRPVFRETVGPTAAPLIKRYVLFRVWRLPRIYLHRFCRSDYDRALHDHPWWFVSILLKGNYYEHVKRTEHSKEDIVHRAAPSIVFRGLTARHRIELPAYLDEDGNVRERGCWTLFITGPRVRPWGFWCEDGWVNAHQFEGCEQ